MISQSKLGSEAWFHADPVVNNAAAHCTAPQASLRSVYDPRCCTATLPQSTFKSQTPRIHSVQLSDGNACACMPLLDCSLPEKEPPFFSPVHWRQRVGAGESADGMKQGFAPPEVILTGHPHPSANERKPNPPPGVARRIQTKASEATRRGSGARRPCHRRGVLRSFRLQNALLPLCRGDVRLRKEARGEELEMEHIVRAGKEGERPAIQ